jgi:hypothetical protein
MMGSALLLFGQELSVLLSVSTCGRGHHFAGENPEANG